MPGDGRITFTPSPQSRLYLLQLKKRGFYGKTLGDVMNQIVNNEIKHLLKDKLLSPLPPELEGSEDEEEGKANAEASA